MLSLPIIIFTLLALFGLIDAIHIAKHTKKEESLICPIGFECNEVVNSKYSTFLGLRNDLLGLLFYMFILLVGSSLILLPNLIEIARLPLKVMTFGAAMFSLYLTYIQAFKLKNFCLYCLFSAGFSIGLFVTSLYI